MRLEYLNYHQLVKYYREEILNDHEKLQELEEKFEKMHIEQVQIKQKTFLNEKQIS